MPELKHSEKLNLLEIIAIGVGGMIGGGIFAVLGLAIATAGHAVPLTLAAAGVIALITGLSYAHLGLAFRGDGGSFTYIDRAFQSPFFSGVAGWLLVGGYVGTLALYATAFGDYGATLINGADISHWVAALLAVAGLLIFLAINLAGARLSGGVELGVVAIKLTILLVFASVTLVGLHRSHFEPLFNKGVISPIAAIALIFVAYEGFELIPNAIDEMQHPERDLRRSIVIAIVLTSLIYVAVSIAAVGNLTLAQIKHQQEYVLAVAAEPKFGHVGFVFISIAAVLSTASAINATLFGAGRLAMVMAADRALPKFFARRENTRPIPYASLLVLTVLAVTLTLVAKLAAISLFASATFLLIFTAVNLAGFRLARKIGLHPAIPLTGAILSGVSFLVLLENTWHTDRPSLLWLLGFYALAAALRAFSLWRQRAGAGATP
jgi:amino acid transporter